MLTLLRVSWQNNAWVNNSKYTYNYDANGNMLTDLNEGWQNNAWVNNSKYSYTYDVNGNSITGKFELWENNNWVLFLNSLAVYSSKNNIYSLNLITRYEAHFVSFANGINENNYKQIHIYPNPASNNLNVNLSQLKNLQNTSISIYDIQGKLLLHKNIQQPLTEINITQFAKGIYVVKVNSENENLQSKFIKD